MKIEILNRLTKEIQCVVEIDRLEDQTPAHRRGLAVLEAIRLGKDLRGANLRNTDFYKMDLHGADFTGADIRESDFRFANLEGANLKNANANGADFEEANLEGANLRRANLRNADFVGAKLQGANLQGIRRGPYDRLLIVE